MEAMCRAQPPALRHLGSDPLTQQHLATWLEEMMGERGGANEHVLVQLLKLLQVGGRDEGELAGKVGSTQGRGGAKEHVLVQLLKLLLVGWEAGREEGEKRGGAKEHVLVQLLKLLQVGGREEGELAGRVGIRSGMGGEG